jgi:hypothetical protein
MNNIPISQKIIDAIKNWHYSFPTCNNSQELGVDKAWENICQSINEIEDELIYYRYRELLWKELYELNQGTLSPGWDRQRIIRKAEIEKELGLE